jgi:hypothetical protein
MEALCVLSYADTEVLIMTSQSWKYELPFQMLIQNKISNIPTTKQYLNLHKPLLKSVIFEYILHAHVGVPWTETR